MVAVFVYRRDVPVIERSRNTSNKNNSEGCGDVRKTHGDKDLTQDYEKIVMTKKSKTTIQNNKSCLYKKKIFKIKKTSTGPSAGSLCLENRCHRNRILKVLEVQERDIKTKIWSRWTKEKSIRTKKKMQLFKITKAVYTKKIIL